MAGAVSSTMVKVAVVLVWFPQLSVAVKITVAVPVAPQRSDTELKLLLHTTPEHTSLAMAPPLEVNHALNSPVLP